MKIYNIKMYIIVLIHHILMREINKSEHKDKATSYTEYEIKMYNQNSVQFIQRLICKKYQKGCKN